MVATTYRVEYWHGEAVDLLGEEDETVVPEVVAVTYAARLQAAHAGGVVVVVAQETGKVAARRALWPQDTLEPAGSALRSGRVPA
jgi:hypothetical protein